MSKAPITRLTSLDIQPNSTATVSHGFYIPLLTTAQIVLIPANELRNGLLVANSTTNALQVRLNGTLRNVNTSLATASGVGLDGSAVILPSGLRANVEVAANQVEGFIYKNATVGENNIRAYNAGGFRTVTVV